LSVIFESDSEYEWLLLIQTPLSYKLNLATPTTSTAHVKNMSATVAKSGSKTNVNTKKIEDLLSEVVTEMLKQVFKEDGAKIIYVFIENSCHLKLEEIAEKPEVFSEGLEKLLGSGRSVIENLVLKSLYRKLGLEFMGKKGYEFSDHIRELRKRCILPVKS
jgi:hypothetical protein